MISRLESIIHNLHWMARRYADGRMSAAVEAFNRATQDALDLGIELRHPLFARDGMGRRYDGLTDAEVAAAEADMPRAWLISARDEEMAELRQACAAKEAEIARLRSLLTRWVACPEVTEIEAEDRDPETEGLWRETRAALAAAEGEG